MNRKSAMKRARGDTPQSLCVQDRTRNGAGHENGTISAEGERHQRTLDARTVANNTGRPYKPETRNRDFINGSLSRPIRLPGDLLRCGLQSTHATVSSRSKPLICANEEPAPAERCILFSLKKLIHPTSAARPQRQPEGPASGRIHSSLTVPALTAFVVIIVAVWWLVTKGDSPIVALALVGGCGEITGRLIVTIRDVRLRFFLSLYRALR
jgi:hypothetical protein